jgi:hypothetical protein
VRGKTRVDVQVREGRVTTAVIEAGTTQSIRIWNPWPGEAVDVVSGQTMVKIVSGATSSVITFRGMAGTHYLLERREEPVADTSFVPVTGVQAVTARRLGKVQIGLFAQACCLEVMFAERMFVDRWSGSELRPQKARELAVGSRRGRRLNLSYRQDHQRLDDPNVSCIHC